MLLTLLIKSECHFLKYQTSKLLCCLALYFYKYKNVENIPHTHTVYIINSKTHVAMDLTNC